MTAPPATRKPLSATIAAVAALCLPLAVGGATASAQATSPQRQSVAKAEHWGSFGMAHANHKILTPAAVSLPGPVAEIGTSNSTQYALLANGTLYAWGTGKEGQLGDGGKTNSDTAVQVRFPGNVRIASIPTDAVPFDTGLAVDTTGHVWGWGLNLNGELCLGDEREYTAPVELPFSSVTAVAGGGDHALYDSNGTVYACGGNREGDLGDGSTRDSDLPALVRLPGGEPVSTLVASFGDSGALLANGDYYDWGYDKQGQLGNGTVGQSSDVPVRVPLPDAVSQVALGGSLYSNGQTLVLLADGSLRAWGDDADYQLGDGRTSNEPSPVPFYPPPAVTYTALASGGDTSYAVSGTGVVYAWGAGNVGQLGDGTTRTVSGPEQVATQGSSISSTGGDVAIVVR